MLRYRTNLTVYRIKKGTSYLSEDGDWIEGTGSDVEEIPIKCSLQPYVNGNEQRDLPDGIRATDARYIFTKTEILQADDRTQIAADEVEIDGVRYECDRVKPFVGFGLITDHYECVFIRKDKLSGIQQ